MYFCHYYSDFAGQFANLQENVLANVTEWRRFLLASFRSDLVKQILMIRHPRYSYLQNLLQIYPMYMTCQAYKILGK